MVTARWSETPPVAPQDGPPAWLIGWALYGAVVFALCALTHTVHYLLGGLLAVGLVGGLLLIALGLCKASGLVMDESDPNLKKDPS